MSYEEAFFKDIDRCRAALGLGKLDMFEWWGMRERLYWIAPARLTRRA